MSDNSAIEWTEATLNVVTGCTRVSEGCDHCYIERTMPFRTAGRRFDKPGIGGTTGVKLHSDRLGMPLRWRKSRRIFVNSLADLFHDDVPDRFIADLFAVMARTPQHTYQILTKRPARMRALLGGPDDGGQALLEATEDEHTARAIYDALWPLPNVWLGVSVENQKWADIRIPALLDTPAAVRWLSCEPLLGPVDLRPDDHSTHERDYDGNYFCLNCSTDDRYVPWRTQEIPPIDWVVVGGESGPGARPMHPDWARSLRDQCTAAGVPFFLKQWGEWAPAERPGTHLLHVNGSLIERASGTTDHPYGHGSGVDQDLVDRGHASWERVQRLGKKRAGRELDGRTWDEYPAEVST